LLTVWPGTIGDWTDEELEKTAEAVGYGAVKYALNMTQYQLKLHFVVP
jgi:arginyl-tRNA synthetase